MSDPLERLEGAWRGWRPGREPPRWESYLPQGPLDPDEALCLMQIDVEFRARHGLPGVLTEPYLERVPLDEARAAELVRWEYRQCRKHGRRARARDYAEAFPRLAAALEGLAPEQKCPVCGAPSDVIEEDGQTLVCPRCPAQATRIDGSLPPPPDPLPTGGLDLRHHELLDALGSGGMGEVYRTRDPGLGRDLALKVLRPAFAHDPRAEARFLREARITAALQHPGIVPVHNLGRLADGRLFFSMKLVHGRTLERHIADKAPGLMAAFERVCEAVAYAHGQGVIHRDLKPANVMVGAFGEVQVMDWGLARRKDEGVREREEVCPPSSSTEAGTVLALAELGRLGAGVTVATRAGTVMGTPAFMPPEQARGEAADERSDVFALGAILCVVLTGRPPFTGDALAQARAGDLGEASARLDGCGADADLVAICKGCLAADPAARPADAGVLARRLAEHREGVERRLREAELERVEARERGRRLRLRLALIGVVALLLASALGVGLWLRHRQDVADREAAAARAEADGRAAEAIERARQLTRQAAQLPHDEAGLDAAVSAAESACGLARAASPALASEAEALMALAREEREQAAADRRLLAALLEARGAGADLQFTFGVAGLGGASTPKMGSYALRRGPDPSSYTLSRVLTAEEACDIRYAAAFKEWGVDPDAVTPAEAAARLGRRSAEVRHEAAAALDDWSLARRRAGRPGASRLLALAHLLDRSVQGALLRGLLGLGEELRRPPPSWWGWQPMAPGHARLVALADEAARSGGRPAVWLELLARALFTAGDPARAERVLEEGLSARPSDPSIYHALAELHKSATPPRWQRAIECYTAARALRPRLGQALASTLDKAGRTAEAVALARSLVERSPRDVGARLLLASLLGPSDPAAAAAAYRAALTLAPDNVLGLCGLANALFKGGDHVGAAAACRRALASDPDGVVPQFTLACSLLEDRRPKEALVAAQKACGLAPEIGIAHHTRGMALFDLRRYADAADAFRRALEIDPTHARAALNLGTALSKMGDHDGALSVFRRVTRAHPGYALGHLNLGAELAVAGRAQEALPPLREAIRLAPSHPNAHAAMAQALLKLGRHDEAAASARQALLLLPPGSPSRSGIIALLRQAWKKGGERRKSGRRRPPPRRTRSG